MKRATAGSENARQLVHIGVGAGALLLGVLPWFESTLVASLAVLFNALVLHRVGGAGLFRPDERGCNRLKSGIVLYPATILCLLLLLPERLDIVAGAWGVLAAGDGMATLVGRHLPVRALPWNPHKSLGGTLSFVLFGGAAAAGLSWWCRATVIPPAYWWYPLAAGALAAVVAGMVETIPISLDDNITVAGTAAAVMWAVSLVSEDLLAAALRDTASKLPLAMALNVTVASAGYLARTVSFSGMLAGGLLGTVIFLSTGWAGWGLLLATFAVATAASRMGLRRKQALGIAEARGGRRGAANAIANTGVATAAGLMGVLTPAHDWALVGFVAALTAGGSDTVASEIGKAWGRRTVLVTTRQRVPPGTPGAMSLEGTIAGLAGASLLAGFAAATGLVGWSALPIIVGGTTAGALLESFLGASYERAGIVNNDVLNFINTATAAYVSATAWSYL